MVDEFGALDDDAFPGSEALRNQDALAIQRLDANRTLFKPFCGDVLVDQILAAALRTRLVRGTASPFCSSSVVREHRHKLAGAQAGDVALNGEVDRDRLIAIRKSCATERKRKRPYRRSAPSRFAGPASAS